MKIKGNGLYCVGLKIEEGWIYVEGLIEYIVDDENCLLMVGYLLGGKLVILF